MAQSMTGYGRQEGRAGELSIVAEIRSTNHKYRDVVIRMPKFLLPLEAGLRKHIQERFDRGRLELALTVNGAVERSKRLELDLELAAQYKKLASQLKRKFGLKGDVDLLSLLNFRDVISIGELDQDPKKVSKKVEAIVNGAMKRLSAMRQKEGLALVRDLLKRIREIEKRMRTIKNRLPGIIKGYQKRLHEKIRTLSAGLNPDPARIAQEVAFFAERTDVHEELTRLASHMSQFRKMVQENRPVGRSLDFLIQEMNREINTIGSKANDSGIAMEVVGVKSELEKMREQVQNIE